MTDLDITLPATATAITPDIVEAGGNLFKLDALVEAYGEILEQAKAQLESYEPDEDTFRKIGEKLAGRIEYRRLSYELADTIVGHPYASAEGMRVMNELVQRIGERLDDQKIRLLIRKELTGIVNERFDDLRKQIDERFEQLQRQEAREARQRNGDIKAAVELLLRSVGGEGLQSFIRTEAQAAMREASPNT